ncbi:MAG: 5-(carboxyamino)imidazole ribonucleotide synthase [Caulobacteraceae bacterium]|nr:5-(carboxyamino)imidazole ribonucleotide synthase [Caulobacteraceae bacterium]
MSFPLAPGATIGILGGGQLGRMLAMAAARIGFDVVILTPETNSPAARVAAGAIVAAYDDVTALDALADRCQVITCEFENVPARALAHLEQRGAMVAPDSKAFALAQDRLAEKTFLNEAGLPTVGFAQIDSEDELHAALARFGAPLLLKTRRGGYDGKGQVWVRSADDASPAFETIGRRPAIAETPADFVRECAVIAARARDGQTAFYPLTRSEHEAGILRRTLAPAEAAPATLAAAGEAARRLLEALGYVGVLGLELFERANGSLLVNEFAPRVHNTGHWTLDGCVVDQFEQHIRAVAGWPLGPTDAIARVEMLNLIGEDVGRWSEWVSDRSARLWLYGKAEARAGRKMGHVNLVSPLAS